MTSFIVSNFLSRDHVDAEVDVTYYVVRWDVISGDRENADPFDPRDISHSLGEKQHPSLIASQVLCLKAS